MAVDQEGGLVTLGGRSVYGAGNYQDSALAQILPFELAYSGDAQIPREYAAAPTALGLVHPILQLEYAADANREAWLDLPTLEGCNRVGPVKAGVRIAKTIVMLISGWITEMMRPSQRMSSKEWTTGMPLAPSPGWSRVFSNKMRPPAVR